jgi:hypothetical protein
MTGRPAGRAVQGAPTAGSDMTPLPGERRATANLSIILAPRDQ